MSDGYASIGQANLASVNDESQTPVETEIETPIVRFQAADLLIPLTPLDVDAVQAAIQSVLQKLDNLGSVMISSPEGLILSFWVLCAVSTAAGCEVVRRRVRRRSRDLYEPSHDDPLFTWIAEGCESTLEYGK
jgi:hypothetical protein